MSGSAERPQTSVVLAAKKGTAVVVMLIVHPALAVHPSTSVQLAITKAGPTHAHASLSVQAISTWTDLHI